MFYLFIFWTSIFSIEFEFISFDILLSFNWSANGAFGFRIYFVLMQRCIVLDIEGTTTPISYVADVLFPYARDNVARHLYATYDTAETKDDIELLRSQVRIHSAVLISSLYLWHIHTLIVGK